MAKILLLYASFGDGHRQVAESLQEAFLESGHEVAMMDGWRSSNQLLASWNERLYEFLTSHLPFVYGWSYDWTEKLSKDSTLWRWLSYFSKGAVVGLMQEWHPDAVIQLFSDQSLRYVKQLNPQVLASVLLTDFALHSRWFVNEADFFLVATQELANRAKKIYRLHHEVIPTGIPIRQAFQQHASGFPFPELLDKPYLAVLTGGRGVFPQILQVVQTLHRQFPQHRVVVCCGRNEIMRKKIENHFSNNPLILSYGYLQEINKLMEKADFIVTKAGGVTIAECLACGTPMLFYKPLPGQERKNAIYIEKTGGGWIAENLQTLAESCTHLTEKKLQAARSVLKELQVSDSAKRVVYEVEERLQGKQADGGYAAKNIKRV